MPGQAVDSPALTSSGGGNMTFSAIDAVARELPESDREKAKMVWGMFQKAKQWKIRQGWAETEENWDFWRGKQWRKPRAHQYSMAVVNEIYSTTETMVGHIGDGIPDTIARPRNPDHIQAAQTVTKLVNWSDDLNEMRTLSELPTRDSVLGGVGILRIDWDAAADGYRGAPKYNFVDQNHIFFSPHARNLDECEFVVEARNVPVSWLKNMWDRGSVVPAGVWDGSLGPIWPDIGQGRDIGAGDYAAFTTTDGASTQISRATGARDSSRDVATLIEAWIRQDDGTMRLIVVANGIVLQDGPSPYDDEMYPYVVINVIPSKMSPYGEKLVSFIKKLQVELNEIHSYALDQQRFESDSPLVVSIANIEEGKSITNAPGSVYIDADPNRQGYYLLNKPGANPHWMEMQQHVIQRMRDIIGNVDILRGDRPPGVTTLGAMEIIRDEASVLVAKMKLHVYAALRRKDLLVISRLRQFLKDSRIVRITGSGSRQEFIEVNPEGGLKPDGSFAVAQTIPADFEADIDFSPAPPGGSQARFERALLLLDKGVVDGQYVLEEIEEDQAKIEQLNGRMEEAAKAQAQAQAQTAVQQVQPGQSPTGSISAGPQDEQQVMQDAMAVLSGMI